MSDKSPSKAPPPPLLWIWFFAMGRFIRRIVLFFLDRVPGSVPPPRGPR